MRRTNEVRGRAYPPRSHPASRVALIAGLVVLILNRQLPPTLGVPLMFAAADIPILDMLRVLRELLERLTG
jgi:hypothetical protein